MADLQQAILELLKEEFGEYSYFEVKKELTWNTLENKAEFIRDIQSLCNSLTEEDNRYLVIGYDKHKKTFEDVKNYKEFDDGKLVSLLSAYFDPEITFKSYAFKTGDGKNFIVIEFPSNKLNPPHLIKKEITQQNKPTILSAGEIWIKGGGAGGSSAKRRATRDDLYGMFDLYVERQAEKRAQIRVDEILRSRQTTVVAQELILPENFDISIIYREDEIFIKVVKQLILGEKSTYLRELTETLRQNLLASWKKMKPKDGATPEEMMKFSEEVYDVKTNQIIPSIRKLTILATQLIRDRAYPSIFDSLLATLTEFYNLGYDSQYGIRGQQNLTHPNENLSYSLPSVESMTVFNLLGAYATKVNNEAYISKLVNLTTKWEGSEPRRFMMFLSLAGGEEHRSIAELRNPDGQSIKNAISFYSEKGDYLVPYYFDDGEDLLNWLSSFDLIKEFNSYSLIVGWESEQKKKKEEFLAVKKELPEDIAQHRLEEIEADIMGEYRAWGSPFTYHPWCVGQDFQRISPLLERFISLDKTGSYDVLKNYFAKDKHNKIDFSRFDKLIYDTFEGLKRQRVQQYMFSITGGWVGAEVDTFLKETAKKYPDARQSED